MTARPADLPAFLLAHPDRQTVHHRVGPDLAVLHRAAAGADVYAAVDANRVWDVELLHRLLALATAGHPAREDTGLPDVVAAYLPGEPLPAAERPSPAAAVHVRPLADVPRPQLVSLAREAVAVDRLFHSLSDRVNGVIAGSTGAWGRPPEAVLRHVIERFGPLTHHVQVRAAVLADALWRTGIGVGPARRTGLLAAVGWRRAGLRERLRRAGVLADEPAAARALQHLLARLAREHPEVPLAATAGGRWETTDDQLAEAAAFDPVFADYAEYRQLTLLTDVYLKRMTEPRLHARYQPFQATGRVTGFGGFNPQALPHEPDRPAGGSVRGCFTPGPGRLFGTVDLRPAELVALAQAVHTQFGRPSGLRALVNAGADVHREVAGRVRVDGTAGTVSILD